MNDRRYRTHEAYNLHLIDHLTDSTGSGMPILDPCDVLPARLRGFNTCPRCTDGDAGVHFFLDDYRFEGVWSDPLRYVEMLSRFRCVLTPDFSLYLDMLEPMQRYNVFRGRAVGRIWQDAGLDVVPALTWGFEETYSFCFDGIPQGATVAVSTVGLMRCAENRAFFAEGVEEGMRRIRPQREWRRACAAYARRGCWRSA